MRYISAIQLKLLLFLLLGIARVGYSQVGDPNLPVDSLVVHAIKQSNLSYIDALVQKLVQTLPFIMESIHFYRIAL